MAAGLVSVIIPTFNRAGLIRRAVDSALGQDCPSIEVLIIDDGSKDDTAKVVTAAYGSDSRVRYLSQANGGVSSARNHGLRVARGEFVAFLDADDTWLPGKVALQLSVFDRLPEVGMVWSDMAALDPEGAILHSRYLRQFYGNYRHFPEPRDVFGASHHAFEIDGVTIHAGDAFGPMALGNLVHTSTVILRRSRAEKVGFFDENVKTGEDYPFHLATCKAGRVAFADSVTTHYRIGMPDSLSRPSQSLLICQAFLNIFHQSMAASRNRINLPHSLIQRRIAEIYAWACRENLDAGHYARALGYFFKSLKARPFDLSNLKGITVSLVPLRIRRRLVSIKRGLR